MHDKRALIAAFAAANLLTGQTPIKQEPCMAQAKRKPTFTERRKAEKAKRKRR